MSYSRLSGWDARLFPGLAAVVMMAKVRCALLAHAISDRAKRFCERHGFTASEVEPMTLMITLREAKAELG
jgi:hypothetical protein